MSLTKTSENADGIRSVRKRRTFLISRSVPRMPYKAIRPMINVETDQTEKFSLTMEGSIAMMRPDHMNESFSKMNEIMIGHSKVLQK